MFKNSNNTFFANWFPGKTVARDRWGNAVGTEIRSREFQGSASTPAGVTERLRWSLGHY